MSDCLLLSSALGESGSTRRNVVCFVYEEADWLQDPHHPQKKSDRSFDHSTISLRTALGIEVFPLYYNEELFQFIDPSGEPGLQALLDPGDGP